MNFPGHDAEYVCSHNPANIYLLEQGVHDAVW